ncbi:MAG: hypothetical protein ACLSTO_13250 [Bilophila wadsworthia]
MQYLTEQDLMARCGLGQGVELHLSPEERLTPSAQELVNNRKIRILIVSGDGRVARDDGKAVHPLATEERPFAKVEKTEAQTHLNGTEMVTRASPDLVPGQGGFRHYRRYPCPDAVAARAGAGVAGLTGGSAFVARVGHALRSAG